MKLKKFHKKLKTLKKCLFAHGLQRYLKWVLLFVLIYSLGVATGHYYNKGAGLGSLISTQRTTESAEVIFPKEDIEIGNIEIKKGIYGETKTYVDFLAEVYDKIKENYWKKMSDEELINLFKLGAEKIAGVPQELASKDKDSLELMLTKIIQGLDSSEQKKEFTTKLADIVLANLEPLGRSRLYTTKEKKHLADRIKNVNPQTDLHKTLEVEKDAPQEEVEEAFEKKSDELEKELEKASGEEKEKKEEELKVVKYAYDVLSDTDKKEKYEKFGIEPTIFSKLVRPDIFHIYIKKFAANTFNEFKKAADSVDNREATLDTLILDLRANIGGSIDILPYFLGPFIGKNQYAYEFFHQGEYTPFKTKIGWMNSLVRYKKVVILIDGQSQSSAEVMAAALKKYNVGVVVGTKTKGWGTVEKVLTVDQQISPDEEYSMFLVHHITLRDDGQPIEGRGVDPVISMNAPDWEKQLFAYFHYNELTEVVKEIWNQSPNDFY